MADFVIRQANVSDEVEILVLWDELGDYYRSLNPVYPVRWTRPSILDHRRELLAAIWADPENHAGFVALVDGQPAGFIRADITPDGPAGSSLHTLVVRPPYRSLGIGSSLMATTISWCDARGVEDISLDVIPVNTSAAQFHESLGFAPFLTSYVKRLR